MAIAVATFVTFECDVRHSIKVWPAFIVCADSTGSMCIRLLGLVFASHLNFGRGADESHELEGDRWRFDRSGHGWDRRLDGFGVCAEVARHTCIFTEVSNILHYLPQQLSGVE